MHEKSSFSLAIQATTHCLIGCGLGDIVGVILGTALGMAYIERVFTGLILGFIFGLAFGMLPLIQSKVSYMKAAQIVITTEIFSILTMEIAEAATELTFPGMRRMGLMHIQYWIGLTIALVAGFVVALPVNFWLVKQGVRHHH